MIISCKSWCSESVSFNLYIPFLTHYISKTFKADLICITELHYNLQAAHHTDFLKLMWKLIIKTSTKVSCSHSQKYCDLKQPQFVFKAYLFRQSDPVSEVYVLKLCTLSTKSRSKYPVALRVAICKIGNLTLLKY